MNIGAIIRVIMGVRTELKLNFLEGDLIHSVEIIRQGEKNGNNSI